MDGGGGGDGRSGEIRVRFPGTRVVICCLGNSELVFDVAQRGCLPLTHHGTSLA